MLTQQKPRTRVWLWREVLPWRKWDLRVEPLLLLQAGGRQRRPNRMLEKGQWTGVVPYCTLRSSELDSCQHHGHSLAVSWAWLGQKRSRKHMYKDVFYLNKNWISSVWAWLQERQSGQSQVRPRFTKCSVSVRPEAFWPFAGVFASIFPSNILFLPGSLQKRKEWFQ